MERKHRALLLALPTVLTLLFFFVAPMVYILVHTLHENGLSDFVDFFGDPFYRNILWVTLRVSLVSTAISLVLGYPTAFYMARTKSRMKQVMMIVILFPFLVSAVVRSYGWMVILGTNGLLNQLFQKIGLISLYNHIFGTNLEYFPMMNTQGAVVLGMVYNYLPFMILPIYSVIIKLDHSLLEAARDLGAGSLTVFRRVILPLSLPGVVSGITMVFVPSVSTFAISRMLGGGTELLLGDLIERQFLGGAYNPQLGAAISLVMMIIVLVCMLVMNRFGEGEEQAVKL